MAFHKFSENLFLAKQELNRLRKFLDDDGFRKLFLQNSIEFGLVKNNKVTFINGKISVGDTGKINQAEILAIDNEGKIIYKPTTTGISVTNDNQWYWVKITHQYSSAEEGTVSIDSQGNLTGVDTKFLEVLRGQPDIPSKIKFLDASLNTLEYEVLEVISDTNAVLQGTFSAENDLTFSVVGSFTPGAVPIEDDKNPFQYDSCSLSLVVETVLNTPPSFTEGEEFYLARVKNSGGTVVVQDKRVNYVYKSTADYFAQNVTRAGNPLLGVESVKYDHPNTPRDKNIVYVAWGFRSSNWTLNTDINRVTLNAGEGGIFKDTSYFTDDDFNGWRLYTSNGKFAKITASSLSGSQINITLDVLEPDWFEDSDQEILIVPDAEEIELIFRGDVDEDIEISDQRFKFPINKPFGKCPLVVYKDPSCTYNLRYQYKHIDNYSEEFIPNDDVVGYYDESSFDNNGKLNAEPEDRNRVPYTVDDSDSGDGFITLTLASNAYINRIASVETGDLFGVNRTTFDNNNPIINLTVGSSKQIQVFEGTISFTTDHIINLKTTGAIEGNKFILDFRANMDMGNVDESTLDLDMPLYIVSNYINPGNIGTILLEFNTFLVSASKDKRLLIICVFDGANWVLQKILSSINYQPSYSEISETDL